MSDTDITVLLIEDNPGDARLIELALSETEGAPIRLERAERLADGLKRLNDGGVDVLLLDLSLPDSFGLETFERTHLEAPGVPIVVLSGLSDEQLAVDAVNAGAQDYLVKGKVDGESLRRAIRYALERHEAMNQLQAIALVDELTGLRNRRGFITLGEQALRVADRTRIPLALVFIDVNGMKTINDGLGHQEGDRALRDVADVLRLTFRDADIVARVGGDEFCALLQIAPRSSIDAPVERVHENLLEFQRARERPYRLTISVGAHLYDPEKPCSLHELMEQADRLMYREKLGEERRSRLLVIDDDPVLRRLAETLFEGRFDVTTAANGAEAVEAAAEQRFDLFLVDVRLPDRPGTEVVRVLRQDPATTRIPIIIMTGMQDEGIELEGLRLGADDFVRKPFNEEVLLSRVENAIARSRRR